jgi:hypothetical protein
MNAPWQMRQLEAASICSPAQSSRNPSTASMNRHPLQLSIREITETKRLLEKLLSSSESFDYIAAKAALVELRRKIRVLGKLQADLSERNVPDDRVLRFPD